MCTAYMPTPAAFRRDKANVTKTQRSKVPWLLRNVDDRSTVSVARPPGRAIPPFQITAPAVPAVEYCAPATPHMLLASAHCANAALCCRLRAGPGGGAAAARAARGGRRGGGRGR